MEILTCTLYIRNSTKDKLSDGSSVNIYAELKKYCAFFGKFGVSGTFCVIYVHTSELYPTPVRGIGLGLSSDDGRIGGISAPLINSLG